MGLAQLAQIGEFVSGVFVAGEELAAFAARENPSTGRRI
jgi:hypothetical protein